MYSLLNITGENQGREHKINYSWINSVYFYMHCFFIYLKIKKSAVLYGGKMKNIFMLERKYLRREGVTRRS